MPLIIEQLNGFREDLFGISEQLLPPSVLYRRVEFVHGRVFCLLHARDAQVRRLLAAQVPKRQIARLCQVDRNTLDRYIRQVINNPDAQQNGGE